MMQYLIFAMIILGSALMVYNIYGFIRFARFIRSKKTWDSGSTLLYVPIVLLVFFLIGYLIIGFFGDPDIIMAGVLFGGSVFVFIVYRLLFRIVRRLTQNERLEAELMAAEESNRAKNSFLATISHEMRTPMNVIIGMDVLALKNPDLPEQTRSQLEKIGYSARHLTGLIDNILDLQESGGDGSPVRRDPFSLREALDQINAVMSATCEEKGLTYETAFEESAFRDYTGDAQQLKRALMNILDNAVKFTDAPGTVRFEVNCTKTDGVCTQMHFIIRDTGVGIDEEFLPRIFDRFAREDESFTSRYGGSGLGLAAAHNIVTNMGGTIEAGSKKGEGAVFTVSIPIAAVSEEERAALDEAAGLPEEEVSLEGRRILIVEDVPENAEIVADLLEMEGAQSDWAQNGEIAVNMIKESERYTYDAILMDLRMPVMDGLEAAGRIRALPRPDAKFIPIIALTANAYEVDMQNSLKAGMNGHLSKPVDADMLCAELKKWIRRAEGEGSKVDR